MKNNPCPNFRMKEVTSLRSTASVLIDIPEILTETGETKPIMEHQEQVAYRYS
jgi:hypothetical protein